MYIEGEVPYVSGNGYNNGSGMWGSDGIWAILLLALLGGRGFGFGGGAGGGFAGYGGGTEFLGYELGKVATQADIASGFNNSAVLNSLNEIKLASANGFAGVQQTLCQGFSGINQTVLSGFAGVDNSICTLGYQQAQLANGLSREIADCCCSTKNMILENRYLNEKQTCDILSAISAGNQRLVDMYTNDKIETLNRKLATAEAQLSNNAQSRYITDTILDKLSPCPKPAYITCNPYDSYTPFYGYNQGYVNGGCCA